MQVSAAFRDANVAASGRGVDTQSWNNEFVRSNARWMSANLPRDARVLTSRLYFSSLHVNTEGRFRLFQIPTVRVDVGAPPPPVGVFVAWTGVAVRVGVLVAPDRLAGGAVEPAETLQPETAEHAVDLLLRDMAPGVFDVTRLGGGR